MPEIELTHPSGRTVVVEVDRIPSDMDAFAAEVFASLGTATAGPAPKRGVHPSMAEFGPTSPNKPSLGFGELGTRLKGIGVATAPVAPAKKGVHPSMAQFKPEQDPEARQMALLKELKGHTARLGKAQRNYDQTPWYDILGKRKWKGEIDAVKARMAVVQDRLATLPDYRPATRTIGLSEEQIRGRADLIQGMHTEAPPERDWRAGILEGFNPALMLFPEGQRGEQAVAFGEEVAASTDALIRKIPVLGPIISGLTRGVNETVDRVAAGDLRAIPEFFDPTQIPADPWSDRFTTEEKIQNTLIGMMAFYASKGGPPGAEIVPGMLYETPRVGITELRAGLRRLLQEEGLNEKQAATIANMVEKQAVTATERVKAAAPQVETIFSRKEPIVKEKPDAIQVKQTEEVLQDVRTQPGKGEEALPAKEGGAGVRTKGQAEEVVPVMGPKVSTPKTEAKPAAEPGATPGGSTKKEPWEMTRDEVISKYRQRIEYGPDYDRSLADSVGDLVGAIEKGDKNAAEYFGRIVKLRAGEWGFDEYNAANKAAKKQFDDASARVFADLDSQRYAAALLDTPESKAILKELKKPILEEIAKRPEIKTQADALNTLRTEYDAARKERDALRKRTKKREEADNVVTEVGGRYRQALDEWDVTVQKANAEAMDEIRIRASRTNLAAKYGTPKAETPKVETPKQEPGAIPGGSTKPEDITIGKFRVGSSTYGDALRVIHDPERPFGVWREGQIVKKFATRDEAITYAKEQQAKIDEAATQLDAERAKYPRLVWGKGEEGYIKSAPYREFFEGKSKAVEVGSIPQAFGHDEIVYFWRGKLVRRGSSKTSSGPAPVHEVPSDIVVWKQTKAARAIAPKFGATIETVRTKHVSDAGAMPGLLKPAKETRQVIVSPKPEPTPAKPKVEESETITDEAQQFQEEVSPKSGGMGSRKRGAVRGVDVGDTLAGVSEAVASVADRVAGKGLFGSVRDAVRGIFGNVRTKLEAYGKVGVDIANDLSAVLADAAHGTARDGFTIKESVRTSFGKVFGLKREARTSLGLNKATENIVHKIENGIPLTAKEKRVWDTWVTIQGRLLGEAKRHGVPVERQVGRIDPEILMGREVRWVEGGQIRSGKVIGGDADALLVETSAGQTVLERGTKFVSEQLVDPERYFPRVLKPEVYRDLFTEGSKVREAAVRHVMDTHGIGRADAEGVIHEAFGSGVVEIDSPISSRLRRERTGGLLPDEFYNRNFLEVVEAHIAKAHLDIAAAKKWGGDFAGLAEKARQVPHGGEQVLEIVRGALSPKRDLATRSGLQAAAIEGAYQALTKLTMLPTAFIQLTQQASTIGLLGVKAWAKAWGQMGIDAVTGRRLIDAVKLSGAIDQDVLSLIGFSDLRGVVRDVTSGGLTPMRAMDRLSRVQSAVAGLTAVRDALMRVRLDRNGRIRNNAAYRFLREFAELNDEDILRMKQNGMTKDDAIRAMNTGAKTQVRTREVDLPDFAHTPFGRIFMRFKTYAYGQTALVGWAGKEAARGNLMPAARLIMAGVIAGQGVQAFRDAWNGWLYGEEAKRKTAMEKGQEIWAEFQNGIGSGASKLWEYAVGNLLDAGTLGLLGYAIEEADPKNSWKNQWEPVSAQTLMNIIGAVSYGFKNEEDWIDAWKAAGIDFSTKEALWVKAAWKMTHGGKTFRQEKQAEQRKPSTPKSTTKKVPDPLLSRPRRGSDPFAPPP